MARNNKDVSEVKKTSDTIFLKANRPLTILEHEQLSQKLKFEEQETGLKIVLIPNSLDIKDGE